MVKKINNNNNKNPRKTEGGGFGSVDNKRISFVSVPLGPSRASPSPRTHFLASVSRSRSFRALYALPRGTGNS